MNLLGAWGYRILGIALAIGLMMLQGGYCPMSARGEAASDMASMPCCQGHNDGTTQDKSSGNHRTSGICTLACCTIGITTDTEGYQVHLVRGEAHVAWTVPQLESWNTGVILRPPRV